MTTNSQDGNGGGSVTGSQAAQDQATDQLQDDPMYQKLGESQFGDTDGAPGDGNAQTAADADPLEKGEATLTATDDSAFGAATANVDAAPTNQDGGRVDGNPNALIEGNIVADEDDLDPKKG